MLISDQGTLVRTPVAEVSQVGRNTQGVTLIRLPESESLIGVVRVDAFEAEDAEDDNAEGQGTGQQAIADGHDEDSTDAPSAGAGIQGVDAPDAAADDGQPEPLD